MLVNSLQGRLFVFCLLIGASFGIAYYHKIKINDFFKTSEAPLISKLPSGSVAKLFPVAEKIKLLENETSLEMILQKTEANLLVVHFWGTWCAPCEAELPSFVELTKKLVNKNVIFLLVAINDKEMDVKKFLSKKLPVIPENMIIALDDGTKLADQFATAKVPETFIFDKKGLFLRRYQGPQDWSLPVYSEQIINYLQ